MNKKIVICCSVISALSLAACTTGSADRFGTALGDIKKLQQIYTLNSSDISSVREVLGTPNYSASTDSGKELYVYTYKVTYPFEGLSLFSPINAFSHNKDNVLNDEIEASPTTAKILALLVDNNGVVTDDYRFGFKYIFSKKAAESNNSYCITDLTDTEMTDYVNFSQYEIEAVADRNTKASTFKDAIKTRLEQHFGGIHNINDHVTVLKEDGASVASRPKISKQTYCNEITCNKQI